MVNPGQDNKKNSEELKDLEVKQSKEKFKTLSDQSAVGISIIQDNMVKYANKKFVEMMGYSHQELMKMNPGQIFTLIHPNYRERVIKISEKNQAGAGHIETNIKYEVIKKGGNIIWIDTYAKSIMFQKKPAAMGIHIDITERVEAEKKLKISEENLKTLNIELEKIIEERTKNLKESEEKYRLITENANDLIALYNEKLECEYINEKVLYDILGYTFEEIKGENSIKTIHPDDLKIALDIFKSVFKEGEGYGESRIKHKDGNYKWLESKGKVYIDQGKKKLILISRDTSERKKAEQKLMESETKYREAYNQANFYKDLFAHDMYNILQNVLSSAELCALYFKHDKSQERVTETLSIIRDQVKKGSNLIFKVQKLSEIEEARLPIEPKDVCKFIKKSTDFVKESFQTKDLNIHIETFNTKILVQANDLLFDVFENILINGIRHNINSTIDIFIKISKEQRNGVKFIKLEFKDNGIGIRDDHKKIIFQRGTRDDISAKGMGLGLSLVKKIIDSYNGKIWVEDKVKGDHTKGSNFILLIPRAI